MAAAKNNIAREEVLELKTAPLAQPGVVLQLRTERLMQACKQVSDKLAYPDNMVHFEDFTAPRGDDLGDPFEVEVDEPDTNRKETLVVPSDKTPLLVLHEAGFDNVMSSCETGGCGACKVTLGKGKVIFNSQVLSEEEKKTAMQSRVDRGVRQDQN